MTVTDDVSPLPDWLSADLEAAIEDCREACGSPPVNDVVSNYTWLLAEGEWAAKKFKAFSQHAHLFPQLQEHISIVMLPLTSSGAVACGGIREPKTLTEACLWLQKFQQNNCIRLIVTCSPFSQHSSLEPRHTRTYLKDIRRKQIKAEDVYESALIAFLFLAKKYCVFGLYDLYQLVASITGHEDEEEDCDTLGLSKPSSIQCPPCELCRVPSTEDTVLWNSVSPRLEPLIPFSSSTKVLKFPSSFPQLSTDFFFMERYRPHGTRPVSESVFSIWGDWTSASKTWTCIIASKNRTMTRAYQQQLEKEFTQGSKSMRYKLVSHWVEVLHHLYHLGLNNYHIIVRGGVRHLHEIKYKIAAKPNVGAAHICLTYMNQLEYQRRLLVLLQANLETFPDTWAVPQKPPWVEGIGQSCQTLIADNKIAEGKARAIRKQIMEQLSISQSAGHGYLTMLATAFVPISAIASIFGMNTREINGSAWPIKYFVISAVPLTVALVLLPLIALPLLDLLIRINSAIRPRRWLIWFLLSTFFAFNLGLDIFKWSGQDYVGTPLQKARAVICLSASFLTFAYIPFFFVRGFCVHQVQGGRRSISWGSVYSVVKPSQFLDGWDFLAFSVSAVVYFVLFSFYSTGLELIPLGLYGAFKWSYTVYSRRMEKVDGTDKLTITYLSRYG